jgi:tRNA threonylcarbamoyladenosine biosynthesis protein TsaE
VSPAAGEPDPVRLRTESADDTRALGATLARALRPGDMVLLAGDLGSGKTTLSQGVAVGLGVDDHVTSPTFTLVRSYPCRASTVATFVHADLYRLEHLHEVADLALDEMVEDGGVAVIEWGDGAAPLLGAGSLAVGLAIDVDRDHHRVITLRPADGSWAGRWTALRAVVVPWLAGR